MKQSALRLTNLPLTRHSRINSSVGQEGRGKEERVLVPAIGTMGPGRTLKDCGQSPCFQPKCGRAGCRRAGSPSCRVAEPHEPEVRWTDASDFPAVVVQIRGQG